jgi:hypothetical protein
MFKNFRSFFSVFSILSLLGLTTLQASAEDALKYPALASECIVDVAQLKPMAFLFGLDARAAYFSNGSYWLFLGPSLSVASVGAFAGVLIEGLTVVPRAPSVFGTNAKVQEFLELMIHPILTSTLRFLSRITKC